jgi:hypothetical protein
VPWFHSVRPQKVRPSLFLYEFIAGAACCGVQIQFPDGALWLDALNTPRAISYPRNRSVACVKPTGLGRVQNPSNPIRDAGVPFRAFIRRDCLCR